MYVAVQVTEYVKESFNLQASHHHFLFVL